MVELLVGLTLGLLVAGAAVATLIVGRVGFTSVDSATELRENARFAASLISRIAVQSGFEDAAGGHFSVPALPGVRGYVNAMAANPLSLPSTFPTNLAHNSRNSLCTVSDTSCANGSDVLILSYWGVSTPPAPGNPADGSMINCAGIPEPERTTGLSYSVFHVERTVLGAEPTLVCSYQAAGSSSWLTVPLVTGVESFKVMYGTDNVTPGTCSAPVAAGDVQAANQYLTAAQLDVGGAYCANNWARVRNIRIGMVVRGPVGSAGNTALSAQTWTPLAASGAAYSFVSSTDTGTSLAVPADGRLRQQLEFTIHLRNQQ